MLHSRSMLALYEALARALPAQPLEVGDRVGRGFADIGHEEFIVLTGNRLLSLLTGAVTELNQDRREHLFLILSADQLLKKIIQASFEVVKLESINRRSWVCLLRDDSGKREISIESPSIEEAFVRGLLEIYQVQLAAEARCLKVEVVNG